MVRILFNYEYYHTINLFSVGASDSILDFAVFRQRAALQLWLMKTSILRTIPTNTLETSDSGNTECNVLRVS